jgi:hypothetical protein
MDRAESRFETKFGEGAWNGNRGNGYKGASWFR